MSTKPKVEILGDGAFAGQSSNITDYSVSEDATPVSLHTLTGGVAGIRFGAIEDPSPQGTVLLRGERFRLTDPYAGRQVGLVDSLEVVDQGELSIQASGLLVKLVCQRTVPAYSGYLQGALEYYFGLCGLDDMPISILGGMALTPVDLPAWTGDVWTVIKKLAVIKDFDLSEVDGVCVVRPRRERWIDYSSTFGIRRSLLSADAASKVEVYYYNNQWQTNAQVFPIPGTLTPDVPVLQVGASETLTTNIPVNMWIQTIDAPTQVTHLEQGEIPAGTVYAVVDKDGKEVQPQDWENAGGSLSVAIGADGKSVDLTVHGMATNSRAPYRIASSSDDETFQYSALYIVATGMVFDKKMIESPTGAGPELASVDEVVTLDDPMIDTVQDAGRVLAAAVSRLSGHAQTIVVDAARVNRRGETGVIVGPTLGEFDSEWTSGSTLADFDDYYAGMTLADFDQAQNATVVDDFENQAFGSMGGARVRDRNTVYRVVSATGDPGGFTWTADFDTTIADFDAEYAGMTLADFDAAWAGSTILQHAANPLYTG